MDQDNLNFEQTLDESKMLLDDASRVADEDYEFTLESILAEFGGEQSVPDVDLSAPKPAVSIVPNLADLPQDEDEAPEEPDDSDGMGRLVRESCDFLVSIPLKGRIQSLNASNAAAILLYEAVRQRG